MGLQIYYGSLYISSKDFLKFHLVVIYRKENCISGFQSDSWKAV